MGYTENTALVIHPVLPHKNRQQGEIAPEQLLEEAISLTEAIWLQVIDKEIINVTKMNPSILIGKGQAENIAAKVKAAEPEIVIVNTDLSPVQQRNLEKLWKTKVIDRTGLILEIFGERAQTKEGQIQVELAALEYQKSRLVRSWTHLERQRGGAGFMGGPGETQIELDRRMITDRIVSLKKSLEQVRKNRDLQRKSRDRVPFPIIALVGYTNAGKSTLFNELTGAEVFAKDLLFATLDPTMRKIKLDDNQDVIISDTVGFISDLPTHLVAAFRSTLEQVEYADIILHIRDMADLLTEEHKKDVIEILDDMGISYDEDNRIIEVLNKADLLSDEDRGDLERVVKYSDDKLLVSAVTGLGLEGLQTALAKKLSQNYVDADLEINASDGEALAWLYDHAKIIDRNDKGTRIDLHIKASPADLGRFQARYDYDLKERSQ